MKTIDILLLGCSLAMDATAVSICKGLSMKKLTLKNILIIAIYFGFFQAFMPLIGYLLGTTFSSFVESIDHWIAFILLAAIGFNMIKEIFEDDSEVDEKLDFKTMFPLAVATSIDALAVGISLAFLKVNMLFSVSIIGIITFILSFIGVVIGNKFGNRYGRMASLLGGVCLIGIGLKILLEHLNII